MTLRERMLLGAGVFGIPLLLSPLLLRPVYAIGLVCAVGGLWLAWRGVEYPLTLTAIFSILIAFLGRNPFPHGVISELGFLWVTAAIVLLVLREPDALPMRVLMSGPVLLSVATALWMLARLGASGSPSYGSFKLQLFVIENLAFLVAGIAVARRKRAFRVLLVLTLAMAAISALVLVRDLATGHAEAVVGGRLSISSDFDPIIFGRDAARAISVAAFFLLASRSPGLRLVSLASLPFLAVAFTSAGSRGPALGLVVGLLVLFATSLREREARRRILLVFGGGLLAAFLVAQLAPGQNVARSLSFLTGNTADTSSNGRTSLWQRAWHLFTTHPLFGVGTGGYHAFDQFNLYPHNLFLETLAELGLVGGMLVAATLALGAVRLRWAWRAGDAADRQDVSVVASLLAAAFVNAMFSGDITTNSALWLSLGLAVGLARRHEPAPAGGGRLRLPRRTHAPRVGVTPPHRAAPRVEAPRIVAPEGGATVQGVVEVEVARSRTGGPVALVRLEWETAEGRRVVAESDQRTFEVEAGGVAAVVRSSWLADLVAAALDTSPKPSRRRPWSAPGTYRVWWDASAAAPGAGSLRAVVVDELRREAESEPVRLVVEPSAPGEVPDEAQRADAHRRVAELRRGLAQNAEQAAAAEHRLEELTERLRAAEESLAAERGAGRRAETAERRVGELGVQLAAAEESLAAAARERDERTRERDGLSARLQELAAAASTERAELTARLTQAVAAAAARHRELARRIEQLEQEKASLEARPAEQRVAAPAPAPAAEPARAGGPPTLRELEARAAAEQDPYRRDELEALLLHLRDYADAGGVLPAQFDGLVAQEFGA